MPRPAHQKPIVRRKAEVRVFDAGVLPVKTRFRGQGRVLFTRLLTCIVVVLWLGSWSACRREAPSGGESASKAEEKKPELVVFPPEVQVAEGSVNDFVRAALARCAAGDYDAFRALWTARQEPLPRGEFEEGWQAVQRINVRALEKALLASDAEDKPAEPETVYVMLVEVSLDPAQRAGQREPNREIVLMLSREREEWRLARPPKAMREWIKERVDKPTGHADKEVPSGDTGAATAADRSQKP